MKFFLTVAVVAMALSACTQAAPVVTSSESPSVTPLPNTVFTSTSTPVDSATPIVTSLPETPLSFQAFPVAEGETLVLVNARVIDR